MLELKTRVEELKMENEYQLRLKDMNYSEKIKELTDKFIQEMESLKTKNQVCLRDKTSNHKYQEIFFSLPCTQGGTGICSCNKIHDNVWFESIADNIRNDYDKVLSEKQNIKLYSE